MKVEYRILQYRESPARQEGRNFAFLAQIDGAYYLRALGLHADQGVNLAYYRSIAPQQAEWHWVFAEWLHWLQDLVAWSQHRSSGGAVVETILDRIAVEDRQITVMPPRIEDWPDDETQVSRAGVLLDLESRLLGAPSRPPDKPFNEWIEETLQGAEVIYRKGFARDVEVEFPRADGKPFITTFPYALTEPPRAAFKNIAFHGSRRAMQQKVNDAVLSFQRAVASEFVAPKRCIVLTQTIPQSFRPYAAELEELAQLVDVTQRTAPQTLQQLLGVPRPE